MYRPKPDARCKVWGDDTQILQEIAELIRNHYAPHVSQSQLLRSKEGGFHLFVEVYKEGSNR